MPEVTCDSMATCDSLTKLSARFRTSSKKKERSVQLNQHSITWFYPVNYKNVTGQAGVRK